METNVLFDSKTNSPGLFPHITRGKKGLSKIETLGSLECSEILNNCNQQSLKGQAEDYYKRNGIANFPLLDKVDQRYNKINYKEFSNKSIGISSPILSSLKSDYKFPTKVVLAIPSSNNYIKSYCGKIKTKLPSENKAYQIIQKLTKPCLFPSNSFKVMLCGNKISLP